MRLWATFASSLLLLAHTAQAAAPPAFPKLADIRAIAVRDGVSPIPHMTSDDRDGMIVRGVKNYLTADGVENVFLVMVRDASPASGWSVVTTGASTSITPDDQVVFRDAPHAGDDMIRSVRFARATLNEKPAFVALTAERSIENTIPSPSHVVIRVYALERDRDIGADLFVLRGERKPTVCYGNADLALNREIGIPLPEHYDGPTAAGVCGAV